MHDRKKALVAEIEGIFKRAETDRRPTTPAEREHIEGLLTELQVLKASQEFGSVKTVGATSATGPGDVFIASEGYKSIADPGSRPQQWSTGPIKVSDGPLMFKGTLLESGAGGPGGGAIPPLYEPGVVSKLFEPLGVAQLFGTSQTVASQVRYVNEGTALSGAAGVAEAGLKPESTIAMSEVVEPVKKIATLLPISDEMLEDSPSIQSYLNARLSLFVNIEEERQLLRGAGGNELVGCSTAG
jgi:HK97 family phage major capsid protein